MYIHIYVCVYICNIYTMEYYPAIKRMKWMDLETLIQSEVSQKEKNKYLMLTHIYGILGKKMVLMNLVAGQQ